ncbi:MAG: signal peptidase I [Clostridia bacterium]|nr:signal peptidase I [Clostridia bacterium]
MSKKQLTMPTTDQLEAELKRVKYRRRYAKTLKSTLFVLITVAAAAVLIAVLFLPVLQIYGSSMTPTLEENDIVLSVKGAELETGDLVSFYIGNKLLVKRYIAGPGQWVDIDEYGNVSVDGKPLDEPYISEKALGDSDIEYPYQVPENRIFVLGDHRTTSVDSRNTTIGCISDEQIVGKIVFRIWPLNKMGSLE